MDSLMVLAMLAVVAACLVAEMAVTFWHVRRMRRCVFEATNDGQRVRIEARTPEELLFLVRSREIGEGCPPEPAAPDTPW